MKKENLVKQRGDLEKAEERFRLLVEAAPNGMIMVDREGNIVLINSQTEKLFGYSREELLGQKIEILIPQRFSVKHPSYRDAFFKNPQTRAMGAGRELFGLRKDGVEVPIEIGLNPIETSEGIFTLASIIDISERKRMEESRLRLYLGSIVESSEDAVIGKTLDGVITSWNKGAEQIYGYTEAEAVGRPVSLLVPPDHPDEVPNILERIGRGKPIEHYDTIRLRKDGRKIDVSLAISPIKDLNGNIIGASTIARDITSQKDAEERQRQLVRQLESANQELKDFAYVVSHDLKAPLRGISMLSEWIIKDYQDKLDEEGKKQLQLLGDRVKRMYALIDGILVYSALGRTSDQQHVKIDLNQLVKDVIEAIAPPSHIKIEVQPNLPVIYVDETRIQQIFQNLLHNAVKFMDKLKGEIRVCCADDGANWCFRISDNGPGIDERFRSRLFQLFQTWGGKSDSTGIGLALVKKIVETYGGKIWIETGKGEGTTFIFTLPKSLNWEKK